MEINKIYNADCLDKIKELPDNSIDLMFCDPPYGLSSEIIILPNGKPEYSKAADFMSKWEQPNGEFWEEWFKEANRVLKFGGHCLMFGLDRQLFLYKYFACYAGFVGKQSLYWYFISNFPKSTDLSKNLDKNAGVEREVLESEEQNAAYRKNKDNHTLVARNKFTGDLSKTTPSTELAKKYNGMKYSVAPLKQTNETIMVFQKKYKTGSCMHDVIAMENGDDTITCGALDIENNRVGSEQITNNGGAKSKKYGVYNHIKDWKETTHTGRFPSQTICDDGTAAILDGQSGVRSSGARKLSNNLGTDSEGYNKNPNDIYRKIKPVQKEYEASSGGCSKILHKCNYENNDYDIYNYCAKVSNAERNRGLEGMKKTVNPLMAQDKWTLENMSFSNKQAMANIHPTVKPISLLRRILSYFKTPNKQIVLDCFVGSGSLPIACIEENMNFIGYELNPEYFEIAEKRISAAQQQLKLF